MMYFLLMIIMDIKKMSKIKKGKIDLQGLAIQVYTEDYKNGVILSRRVRGEVN